MSKKYRIRNDAEPKRGVKI